MYKVIVPFTDLQDNEYEYSVGDIFPHAGAATISADRFSELASSENKRGEPLIEEVVDAEEAEKPKKRRGKKNNDSTD